jgi:hypothetical protein
VRKPELDPPPSKLDPDLIALWVFALLRDSEDLLQQYLDEWPTDYRAVAQA